MKQKILSGILAGVMALTVMPMAVGAQNAETQIKFSDATYAEIGDVVEITVSIENNPGFVSATIPVEWESNELRLERVYNTDLIANGLLENGVEAKGLANCGWIGYEITDDVRKSGVYHLAWNYDTMYTGTLDNPQKLEFTEDKPLCIMVFTVIAEVTEKVTADVDNAFVNVMDWNMKDLVKEEVTDVTLIFGESAITLAEPQPKPEGLLGDANNDGKIRPVDAMLTLRYSVGLITDDALNAEVCDVNGDGKIRPVDAMLILRRAVGLIEKFPAEE